MTEKLKEETQPVFNPESLRLSGLATIGTKDWETLGLTKELAKFGEGLPVYAGESWTLKSLTGTLVKLEDNLPAGYYPPASIILEVRAFTEKEEKLIYSNIYKNFSIGQSISEEREGDKFIGKAVGPYNDDCEVFVCARSTDGEVNLKLDLTGEFERIYPPATWKPATLEVAAQATAGLNQSPVERGAREIYFIPDPDAVEFEEPGYHQLPDGTWHPCEKCLTILHHGSLSRDIEVFTGGESESKLKKGEGELDKKVAPDEEKELPVFKGGQQAAQSQLDAAKMGSASDAGTIKCKACGAEGNQKDPPICHANCPKMYINDIIFSSWHKAPDGTYHYCQSCVDAVFEANGITQ